MKSTTCASPAPRTTNRSGNDSLAEGTRFPLLGRVESAENAFLRGRRHRGEDLESAVRMFLESLHGFEALELDRPCVTVFGSARFKLGHRYYKLGRALGRRLAEEGFAVMTGGGPGIMEAANRGARERSRRRI